MVEVQTCTATVESVWWFPQKDGTLLTARSAITLLGIYPKDSITYIKDIYSNIFIAVLVITTRNCKQPICLSADEGIKKMVLKWYIYSTRGGKHHDKPLSLHNGNLPAKYIKAIMA